jgi:hypothetical protein
MLGTGEWKVTRFLFSQDASRNPLCSQDITSYPYFEQDKSILYLKSISLNMYFSFILPLSHLISSCDIQLKVMCISHFCLAIDLPKNSLWRFAYREIHDDHHHHAFFSIVMLLQCRARHFIFYGLSQTTQLSQKKIAFKEPLVIFRILVSSGT